MILILNGNQEFGLDLKLSAEEEKKPMQEWKLAEWHKFFKQNQAIRNHWPDWKEIASKSPTLFFKDLGWFSRWKENGDLVYEEIQKVIF